MDNNYEEFSPDQLKALKQLAYYRGIFSIDSIRKLKPESGKDNFPTVQRAIETFIETFCQNNFANTDYTEIQTEPKGFATENFPSNKVRIDIILKSLTYIIWTNKSSDGYFLKKIKDKTIENLLTRLEDILAADYKHLKLNGTNITVINSLKEAFIGIDVKSAFTNLFNLD